MADKPGSKATWLIVAGVAGLLAICVCAGGGVGIWLVVGGRGNAPNKKDGDKGSIAQPRPDDPAYLAWRTKMAVFLSESRDVIKEIEKAPKGFPHTTLAKKLAANAMESSNRLPGAGAFDISI